MPRPNVCVGWTPAWARLDFELRHRRLRWEFCDHCGARTYEPCKNAAGQPVEHFHADRLTAAMRTFNAERES